MSKERDLLRRALDAWDRPASNKFSVIFEEIRAFLDTEKEAEPVAWTNQHELNALGTDVTCYMYSEPSFGEMFTENDIPLYTRPDPNPSESIKNQEVDRTRKPMTDEELARGFTEPRHSQWQAFVAGARWAEKHQGIGGDDE
jgi:hypothetical protein